MNLIQLLPEILALLSSLQLVINRSSGLEHKETIGNLTNDVLKLVEKISGRDILDDEAVNKAVPEIVEVIETIIHVIETTPSRDEKIRGN